MDGNTVNTDMEIQETASSTTAAEGTAASTPEKVSTLQKFINGLFGEKKTGEEGKSDSKAEAKGSSMEEPDKASATKTEKQAFSEADMSAAIEAARQKWTEEQTEAERVKALSPEEKGKEEQKKKDLEVADLRNQLLCRELRDFAIKELDEEGFPVKLAENLNYSSKEKMEESLKNMMETFKDSLKTAINTRLKGKTPEGLGGAASAENMIKDQIAKNIRGGMM